MSDKQPIRVMIVDDHQMVRRGLSLFIRGYSDLELVGEAANGEEAIHLTDRLQPDIILMDIIMPEINGIEATRIIRERHPNIQIIALTRSSDTDMVTAAMQAGAISYLLKNVSDDGLINAIRAAIHEQQGIFSPEATQALIKAATRPSTPSFQLTEREVEVLALMADGLGNQEIADRLFISRSTVKYHISGVFTKLGVTNRTEAIALAIKNRLI